MSIGGKIGVLISKKYFLMFPNTYLIFHLGQFQILGKTNTCLFSKILLGLSIPSIWQKEGFPSFPPKIIFAPKHFFTVGTVLTQKLFLISGFSLKSGFKKILPTQKLILVLNWESRE